ncbi:MAG: POTRA domain-containing protein, partial [Candidatus Omnitrophica bacterium]|nr:POTRA domain-containing protein [Candidatus Omnitrophota bacterium]
MRKTIFITFLAALIIAVSSHFTFAQSDASLSEATEKAKEEALASLDVPSVEAAESEFAEAAGVEDQPAGKIVQLIDVVGNKSISSNTIISKIKTRIGSPYSENIGSDDIKRLYLLGYFSDIKIDKQDYKDGLKIIITVVERPIIDKISFESMKHIYTNEKKLKDSLKSKEKQYLDYPSLKEDTGTIKKMYEKKGFNEAVIDYRVEVIEGTNKANVTFVAVEN